jgi:phospholipid/cholesterol/gamma-HCH transport system substrate-binding protein
LPDIAQNLSKSLAKIEILLDEENLKNIRESINNIRDITFHVKNYKDDIDTLVKNGVVMEGKVIAAFDKVADAAEEVKHVASEMEKSLHQGDYNLREISSPTFEQTSELLDELKTLVISIEEMILTIQSNPRDFFFKQTAPRFGPGETTD